MAKETECTRDFGNKEIKIYTRKKRRNVLLKKRNQLSTEKNLQNEIEDIEINLDKIEKAKTRKKKKGTIYESQKKSNKRKTFQSIQLSPGRNDVFSGVRLNKFRFTEANRNFSTKFSQEENMIQQQKSEKIKFSYNIFEIFISTFLCCLMPRRLRLKKIITERANNILYNKLDIVLFMRNMILLDIMSKTLVNNNNNKNGIIKFLSKPVVSTANKEQNELDESSKNYEETDFNNFYYEISELVKKVEKRETEKKILSLCNQQLKELVY